MIKTKFSSYCVNEIAEGCKYCVRGRKLVLFISGKCSRNCCYCSLSRKRKNKDLIWANERKITNKKELIEEIKASNSNSAGITGGDPLLYLDRTIEYAKAMKKKGRKFHIHIYLPTKLVDKEKLKKLSKYVDEVRFHPEFLARELTKDELILDAAKIKIASLFWEKSNIGIELPVFPDRKQEILNFILKIKDYIGFVNLNELELSETNLDYITGKYKLEEGGYVVSGSKKAALWILKELEKAKTKLKVHFCTAELKDWHQYKNRLLAHKILPYGKRTEDGTVIYYAVYSRNNKQFNKLKKQKLGFVDNKKMRIITKPNSVSKLINKYKVERVEEYPTYDGAEVMREEIKLK